MSRDARGEVVVPCAALDPTVVFLTGLGFALERLWPADDPRVALVSGHGLRLRVERGAAGSAPTLRIPGAEARTCAGPDGLVVEVVVERPAVEVPALAPAFVLSRRSDDDAQSGWTVGRAGMRYRDLIPGRLGGRYVASHIAIPDAGPVPDAVHFHLVRLQLIFCVRGWVRVVYQDQGPPFRLESGDCVLQPPGIRHRVLESSGDLEVLELGCPAVHDTCFDSELTLPTGEVRPDRDFSGQRFVRHVARDATWAPAWRAGFEARATGIEAATDGLARVEVLRARGEGGAESSQHDGELLFGFVLRGSCALAREGARPEPLGLHDAFVIPPGVPHSLREPQDLELLEIRVS